MAERTQHPDSMIRTLRETVRQGTQTLRPGTEAQRLEISNSLVNRGCRVTKLVRTGPYREYELIGEGRVA